MRRGATWPLAERPSSCLVVQRQSRALAGGLTAKPSCLPSAACAAHSNTVRRPSGVVVPRMSGCPPWPWSPCPHPRVQRPPVQCPVSGACPASARPVSSARCPRMRVSTRPLSNVGCGRPVSRVGVRAFRVGVRGVRSADFLERVGAGGRTAWRRSGSGPGSTAWPARDTPVARQDHPSVEEARPRPLHPICGMAGRKLSGQGCRHQADMTWAETEAATTSGLG